MLLHINLCFFFFAAIYYLARVLGQSITRICGLICLLLIDIALAFLAFIHGRENGLNVYTYLILVFSAISFITNIIGVILLILGLSSVKAHRDFLMKLGEEELNRNPDALDSLDIKTSQVDNNIGDTGMSQEEVDNYIANAQIL